MNHRLACSMARSILKRIDTCRLDLNGLVVATECANGAYASTAAAAIVAGASLVWAVARSSHWASREESATDVLDLVAALGGDPGRLRIVDQKKAILWSEVDVVTNSGHLRPLDSHVLDLMGPTSVIALMFEAWELRAADIDLTAASQNDIPIFGVNEHHAACGSFEYVGSLATGEAIRQGWSIDGARILIISDNSFEGPVCRAFRALGAHVETLDPTISSSCHATGESLVEGGFDLAVIASTPAAVVKPDRGAVATPADLADLVALSGCYGCVQVWGDVERARAEAEGVVFAPQHPPEPGHQAIAMNAVGYEPTVRLQVGGLAAGAHGLRRTRGTEIPPGLEDLVQEVEIGSLSLSGMRSA